MTAPPRLYFQLRSEFQDAVSQLKSDICRLENDVALVRAEMKSVETSRDAAVEAVRVWRDRAEAAEGSLKAAETRLAAYESLGGDLT